MTPTLPRRTHWHERRAAPAWLALCALAFAVAACGSATAPARTAKDAPSGEHAAWITSLGLAHPLVGRVWDTHASALVTFDAAEARLTSAPLVLLGEKHDNPDHHRLQARALEWLVAHGRRPAVVFEMIDEDLQPAVDAYLARPDATVDGLGQVLEWDKRGWPSWSIYRPIFAVIVAAHLAVVASGLGHALIHDVMKRGADALPPDLAARLHLEPLAPELGASLEAEIKSVHCGLLPDAMVAPMSLAQRVKDAVMGDLLRGHQGAGGRGARDARDGAVLIAGAGHVRVDRGVPEYLRRAGASVADVVSVSFVEVADDTTDPRAYAQRDPADLVVFTPRLDDDDPCAKFAAATHARP